jgi:hypothetical protein
MKKSFKTLLISSILNLSTVFGAELPSTIQSMAKSTTGSKVCTQLDPASEENLHLLKTSNYDELFTHIFNGRTEGLNKEASFEAIRSNPTLSHFDKNILMDLLVIFYKPVYPKILIENARVFRTMAENVGGLEHTRNVMVAAKLYRLATNDEDATKENYDHCIYGFNELAKQFPEDSLNRSKLIQIADELKELGKQFPEDGFNRFKLIQIADELKELGKQFPEDGFNRSKFIQIADELSAKMNTLFGNTDSVNE